MVVSPVNIWAQISVLFLVVCAPISVLGVLAVWMYVPRSRFQIMSLVIYVGGVGFVLVYAYQYGRLVGVFSNPMRESAQLRPYHAGLSLAVLAFMAATPALIIHLSELNRLQNEFIASVSHELRTPLAIVMGYAELALDDRTALDGVNMFETILTNAQRMNLLINNILGTYSLEAGKELAHDCIDLTAVVKDTVRDMQILAQKAKVSLTATLPHASAFIYGNELLVTLALNNMISNGIKFNNPGGKVDVWVYVHGSLIELAVVDNGVGMDDHVKMRVFERFYQGDGSDTRRYAGVGLGAYVIKLIADVHDAAVHVYSKLDEGTTFILLFPGVCNEN